MNGAGLLVATPPLLLTGRPSGQPRPRKPLVRGCDPLPGLPMIWLDRGEGTCLTHLTLNGIPDQGPAHNPPPEVGRGGLFPCG